MAEKVIIKRLGQTMTQGTVGRWFVPNGGHIEAGQDVYEMEYDKATANIQAKSAGTLRHLVPAGTAVPVGKPVGVILADGETMESVGFGGSAAGTNAAPVTLAAPNANYDADVIVIGGGPGGYVCANKLGMLGKKVILVERDRVGGTCLNRGCIPTKALLQSAELYESVKNGAAMGVEVEGLKANLVQVDAFREKIVNGLVRGVESLLRARKVETVCGQASFVDAKTVKVADGANERTLTAENIVIATGSKTMNPPIPGLGGKNVLTSTEALHVTNLPGNVAIIGGGVIGMELAVVYANFGTKVTVIEALDKLVAIMDGEVSDECARLLKEKMDIRLPARVSSITDKGDKKVVTFIENGIEKQVEADWVLAALGRAPEFDGLGLENIGIKADRKRGIPVDENFMTAVPGVYAIGDSNGMGMLAHVASAEGITVAEHLCGHASGINMKVVPSCIYCEPEIASVGMTEEQVKAAGIPYKTGKFPFRANGRSMIVGQPVGFVKIIGHASTNEVLGVHIIGPHATEMIGECVAVMKLEGCVEDIAQTIHAHPSVSESIMEAAEQFMGGCIHSL